MPIVAAPAVASGASKQVAEDAAVSTTALQQNAAALEVQGANAVKAAAAQRTLAKETATAARSMSQLQRGAGSATLSMLGLRGATLAASGRFIAGAAAILVLTKAIREASNENEQLNKSRVVFGQFSKDVEDFAKTAATSFGESNAKALELVSTFGALLRPIGFTKQVAEQESVALTKLGADLASFFNTDVASALAAIESGIVGQVRPLRRFGIELSAARVNALALADSGKTLTSALTDQEKVAARIKIIFRDSTIAQGDFARTSGQFANQTRILSAEVANLEGALGRLAVPALTLVLREMTSTIGVAERLAGAVGHVVGGFRDLADAVTKIPKGKLPLPEVPKQDNGPSKFLFGIGKQIEDVKLAFADIPRLFIASNKPIQTESQKSAAAVREIVKATNESGLGIAHFDGEMNKLIETLRKGTPEQQANADKLQELKDVLDALGTIPGPADLAQIMKQLGIIIDTTDGSTKRLTSGMAGLRAVLDEASGAAKTLSGNLADLSLRTSAAAFAGPGAELSQARANQAEGLKHLRALLGLGPDASRVEIQQAIDAGRFAKGRAAAIQRALDEVSAADVVVARAATTAANNKKAAAAKTQQAARDAAQAARDAAQAQTAATEAFIQRHGHAKLDARLAVAAANDNVKAEIAINKAIVASDVAEIAALRERIKHLHLHGDALKAARAAIAAAQQEIKLTQIQIQKDQEALKQSIEDALNQRLDLRIQIASTQGNVAAEIKARRAKLEEITKELVRAKRAFGKNSVAWLQLKEAQAEQIAAIKALQDQQTKTKDTGKTFQQNAFEFLQKQQGFAANLLGNLIPSGATSGLVGGSTPQDNVGTAAEVAAVKSKGISHGQGETTNGLLRAILKAVQDGNSRNSHPEAHHQKVRASASGDILAV